MRVSAPGSTVRFGQVEIRGVQQVIEFEARARDHQFDRRTRHGQQKTEAVSPEAIEAIQSRTAIVVPCKDEPISRIVNVWAGIPASSLLISVSASTEHAYACERDTLAQFCRDTGRNGISVHQRDPQLGKALREIGMTTLLRNDGRAHEGKGEALVIGIALAATASGPGAADETDPSAQTRIHQECHGHNKNGERNGRIKDQAPNVRCGRGGPRGTINGNGQHCGGTCAATDSGTYRHKQSRGYAAKNGGRTSYYKYIGFIDADNFVTGSVSEYCKAFSTGFHLASAQDTMVRINWGSKPKVHNGQIVFKTSGRSSEVVNRHFNRFLGQLETRSKCIISGEACERVNNDNGGMELQHICTGNAGEHAMTMSLALKLRLASGYAIEPFHFLDIFERFAGEDKVKTPPASSVPEMHSTISSSSCSPFWATPDTSPVSSPMSDAAMSASPLPLTSRATAMAVDPRPLAHSSEEPTAIPKVQILQIRTMNPHFHDTDKGEAHITRMWTQGLSAMYHSPLMANFPDFKQSLWDAILEGKVGKVGNVQQDSGTKHDHFPPTPPFTASVSCSMSPPSDHDQVVANGANFEPAECRIYPPAGDFDLARLRDMLLRDSELFWWSGDPEDDQEDVDYIEYTDSYAQDTTAGIFARDEPVQERPLQHVSRRDSGVDFGMDGAELHGATDNNSLGMMHAGDVFLSNTKNNISINAFPVQGPIC
ncbi:hypothetical protein J7T55_014809 [Diaporthe amygdali]|uniref:uncharacterized protein n=1 Tax=Phomopsis amygdali TaxID=1214568 RepID=UPI0022FE0EF5|nr:uncharacterized protein J7T55_014809 [Diaporthe amygdali]KAJ0110007.1 hypothetical protein J7T55_014809 [Diaporthe amygdali]